MRHRRNCCQRDIKVLLCRYIRAPDLDPSIVRNKVTVESKSSSSVFSSGFSGYIRVRPPEPKRDVEIKETSKDLDCGKSESKKASSK
jgi:hypothetical protein